jgi:hypothetical protein
LLKKVKKQMNSLGIMNEETDPNNQALIVKGFSLGEAMLNQKQFKKVKDDIYKMK